MSVNGSRFRLGWFPGRARLTLAVTALFLLSALLCAGSAARQDESSEYKFKALYLFNFLKFVEWPAEAFPGKDAPVVIGVFGKDPIEEWLERTVAGERINGRSVVIRRCSDAAEAKDCQLLFIPKAQQRHIPEIIASSGGTSLLTVGEMPGSPGLGVAINFFIQDKKLRFELNPAAIRKAGLKVDSQLLRLARIVAMPGEEP